MIVRGKLANFSSSHLDEIERKFKERERELEAAEGRVRETEKHARRLRELQEKEAVLRARSGFEAERKRAVSKIQQLRIKMTQISSQLTQVSLV